MPTYQIAKRFTFDASHQLTGLPEDHKCSRLHGHTYSVEVVLSSGTLDRHGFVEDFAGLEPLEGYIRQRVDHRHLNEVLDDIPSSENLARHFFDWCAANLALADSVRLLAVRVSETPSTWAEYRSAGS